VSSPLWQDTKEQIRQSIDIVELVGRYIPLRRQGRIFVGLCPWHDDHRPSLQVNPERQLFRCWVCNIGGDVFSFVMQIEGVDFREAVQMLAEQAGIALPSFRSPTGRPKEPTSQTGLPSEAAKYAGTREGKLRLFAVATWVEKQYHQFLLDAPEAETARRYLAERGISAESIKRFRLGFSPPQPDWIVRRARGEGIDPELLEAVGVLARSSSGSQTYDRFRGRVIFPIRDPQDRAVEFGGRVLPEHAAGTRAKYVNSPESLLFAKSRLLYGLDRARHTMRKSRTALVVEGYTDCVLAHQFGFEDAVAVLGTALGPEHVRLLKRFAERILLILDGDQAGQRRAIEVLELFVAENADLQVVTLPEGTDPADFLLEYGAEAFRELLTDRAADALEHARRAFTAGVDLQRDIQAATDALDRILAIMARSPAAKDHAARIRQERMLQRLSMDFRVSESTLRNRLRELRGRGGGRSARAAQAIGTVRSGQQSSDPAPWQRELVEIILQEPDLMARVRDQIAPEQLAWEPLRRLYGLCCELWDRGQAPTFEQLMLHLEDPAEKSLLVALDESARAKRGTPPAVAIEEFLRTYRVHQAGRVDPAAVGALRKGELPEQEALALLEKIAQQRRMLHGGTEPTEG